MSVAEARCSACDPRDASYDRLRTEASAVQELLSNIPSPDDICRARPTARSRSSHPNESRHTDQGLLQRGLNSNMYLSLPDGIERITPALLLVAARRRRIAGHRGGQHGEWRMEAVGKSIAGYRGIQECCGPDFRCCRIAGNNLASIRTSGRTTDNGRRSEDTVAERKLSGRTCCGRRWRRCALGHGVGQSWGEVLERLRMSVVGLSLICRRAPAVQPVCPRAGRAIDGCVGGDSGGRAGGLPCRR